jgi:hypothetical protein
MVESNKRWSENQESELEINRRNFTARAQWRNEKIGLRHFA